MPRDHGRQVLRNASPATPDQARRTRADGDRTRRAILDTAVRLATVEGLDGLSIGQLAEATGVSKSGLYAHFGSKEDLQLATIQTARDLFVDVVVGPALPACMSTSNRQEGARMRPFSSSAAKAGVQ